MDYIDPRSEEESLTAVRFGQSSIPTELPTKFGEVFVLDVSTTLSKTYGPFIPILRLYHPSHFFITGSTSSTYAGAKSLQA